MASDLCVDAAELPACGHVVCRRSDGLVNLLNATASATPKDKVFIQRRRQKDARRKTLRRLKTIAANGNLAELAEAAHEAVAAFSGEICGFEAFCTAPHHTNARLLNEWLAAAVTGPVTHDWGEHGRREVPLWLNGLD